jgi:hypothetical protein
MRIVVGVGDLLQRTDDSQAQIGYSIDGRTGGGITPCAVYTVHEEISSTDFLVEPEN